jgi:hypothetical protein
MPPPKRDNDDEHIHRSYSRRRGDYLYDVAVYAAHTPANPDRCYAQVMNMVRLEAGHTVSVDAELPDTYGATLDEAFSTIEAAVEEWVKEQTRSQ